jgi:hypothetical protein
MPKTRTGLSGGMCAVVGLVGLMIGGAGGAAFATWHSPGSGTGTGATGTLGPVTVIALVGGPSSSLLPGATSDVVLEVSNANTYPVTLTSIAMTAGGTVSASNGLCTTSGVGIAFPSHPSISVPVGSSKVDLAGAASMSLASQNACQGNTFTFPVTVTFQK